MCDVLQMARSTFYYEVKEQAKEDDITEAVVEIFHKNRKAYGTRTMIADSSFRDAELVGL